MVQSGLAHMAANWGLTQGQLPSAQVCPGGCLSSFSSMVVGFQGRMFETEKTEVAYLIRPHSHITPCRFATFVVKTNQDARLPLGGQISQE